MCDGSAHLSGCVVYAIELLLLPISGASGVGKGTLIRKLINSDHTHFAAVVQREYYHTSV